MYELINEKIDVVAVFGRGFNDVKPIKIRWGSREHRITQVGYTHKVREGQKVIHVFSCTDGQNFFELRFDAVDLKWVLGRTWDDDGQG